MSAREDLTLRYSSTTRGADAAATRIEVAHSDSYQTDDVLMVSTTGEFVRVRGREGDRLLVQRGIGTQPTPFDAGAEILLVGWVDGER